MKNVRRNSNSTPLAIHISGLKKRCTLIGIILPAVVAPLLGASIYPLKLEDSKAVYLTPDHFPVQADGKADDSAAIQRAIDRVQETTGQGVVFIPSGRYRLTRILFVWPAIRLIGYGATRPDKPTACF